MGLEVPAVDTEFEFYFHRWNDRPSFLLTDVTRFAACHLCDAPSCYKYRDPYCTFDVHKKCLDTLRWGLGLGTSELLDSTTSLRVSATKTVIYRIQQQRRLVPFTWSEVFRSMMPLSPTSLACRTLQSTILERSHARICAQSFTTIVANNNHRS